jgi:hypothetical protein
MEDSDLSLKHAVDLDPSLLSCVKPAPERVVCNSKEYTRHPGIRAAETPSVIWLVGEEYQRNKQKFWRCGLCKKNKLLAMNKGTTSALRHLRKEHNIDNAGRRMKTNQRTIIETLAAVTQNVAQVVTRFNADTFRYLFIRWVIMMHIALTCVESDAFRDWVLYVAPGLESYLVRSGDTIRRWILWEFARQRRYIKAELAVAKSRIHISFDLWTSPNSKGLVGVVFHYLDQDLKVRSLLAGMRRVKGAHSGENIAEAVIPIIKEMISIKQLGYFVADNATTNDTAIRAILAYLLPKLEDPDSRRVRCLGHIINLAAKAFLFGNDADAFEEESETKKKLLKLEAVRELWRKKGPLGKFHNTVNFIRKTPQRREAFLEIYGNGITPDIKGRLSPGVFRISMPRLRPTEHRLI